MEVDLDVLPIFRIRTASSLDAIESVYGVSLETTLGEENKQALINWPTAPYLLAKLEQELLTRQRDECLSPEEAPGFLQAGLVAIDLIRFREFQAETDISKAITPLPENAINEDFNLVHSALMNYSDANIWQLFSRAGIPLKGASLSPGYIIQWKSTNGLAKQIYQLHEIFAILHAEYCGDEEFELAA